MNAFGETSEPFFDDAAPYTDGRYATHKGEDVSGEVSRSIQFRMRTGDQCLARGIMEMADGRVYTWTVRAPGHESGGQGGRRRLATLMGRGTTFADHARGLLAFERDRIEPGLVEGEGGYAAQVAAL